MLPEDFDFPLPVEVIGGAVLGPHHNFDVNAIVDSFVPDVEVPDIKRANGKALHVWGVVIYEDVFGNEWETKSCQTFTWIGQGSEERVYGDYNVRHNDAT